MELPNLLNKLKSSSQETKKFIAIEIGASTIKTAIWQSSGSHTEVISTGSIQAWEGQEDIDLITAIDTSLADAQGSIEEEPDQVIFGLPKSWVDDQGIVASKKATLNNVRKKLDLKPIGFVVTIEAIAHHLRDIEGGPPSAIIVQLASNEIAVSVIYLGKLEGTQHIERSTSIASDVEEGLLRIPHSGNLPSRIIVMADMDDVEPIKQEIISHEWQKKVSFLHFPKVESLSKEWSIKAVAIAGGGEVVESLGFANIESSSKEVASTTKRDLPQEESEPQSNHEPESVPTPDEPEPEPESPITQPLPDTKPAGEALTPLGFKPVNFDTPQEPVSSQTNSSPSDEISYPNEDDNLESPSENDDKPLLLSNAPPPKKQVVSPAAAISNRFKSIFSSLGGVIKKPSKKWLIPVSIFILVALIGAGGIFAYYTFPSAIVEVYVNTSPYTQEISFILDPSVSDSDLTVNLIAAQKLSMTETGTKTIPTTGSRLIGDRAKGKIALYNRTDAPKSFQAGSVIKTDTLRFTLNTAVTVASASTKENADFSTTTEPSKVEVAVTASDIGEQYNIAKNTQFSIENFSKDSFFAVATDTFKGGSAKKVSAVAAADIKSVQTELIKELQQKITQSEEATEEGLGQQQLTISEPTLSQEEYSALEGEEASEVSLTATISQDIYQFSGSDVSILAETAAAASLSETQQIKPEQTSINIVGKPVPDEITGQIAVKATITLQHYEKIDSQLVAEALKGVSLNDLESTLQGKVSGLNSVNLKEGKYLIFKALPLSAKQINVRIKSVAGNPSP
jgi:hypothetical protein